MEIILLRHGLAADRERWQGSDASRPLTAPGRKRTRAVAKGLKAIGAAPELVLHSPLLRAEETAVLAAHALGIDRAQLHASRALTPTRSPRALLDELAHLRVERVLCVGHAPHLDRFVEHVLGAPPGGLGLKKAGAACVEIEPPVPHGRLRWVMEPRMLRALAQAGDKA